MKIGDRLDFKLYEVDEEDYRVQYGQNDDIEGFHCAESMRMNPKFKNAYGYLVQMGYGTLIVENARLINGEEEKDLAGTLYLKEAGTASLLKPDAVDSRTIYLVPFKGLDGHVVMCVCIFEDIHA